MLSLQELKVMKPYSMFANGVIENSPDGIYMTNTNIGKKMIWVAKRGEYFDWAIYIHWEDKGIEYVLEQGDKLLGKDNIKKLVPCDNEALEMYRY